ncbi:MAG: hypothetical protein AAF327_15740 [Cyanobacteria bacterium P01_A01_bin.37]
MAALLGIGLLLLGAFFLIISGIWGILLAFQENVVWGLIYVFIPLFGALVFVSQKWRKRAVRTSFLLGLLGLLITLSGGVISLVNGQSFISQLKVEIDDSGGDLLPSDSRPGDVSTSDLDAPIIEPLPADDVSSENPLNLPGNTPQTYRQTMMVGYAAYNQRDYQTALINFRRALDIQPGDRLATEAIQNTEAIIQQQQ